jgi:hypothetical protein
MRRTVQERREHPRVSKQLRVHWQRIDTERSDAPRVGPVEATVTRDVSKGGLSFTVAEPLAAGTVLSLSLEREFGGPPLSALARVARCVANDEKVEAAEGSAAFIVGVEFTWIECAQPEATLGLAPENAWTLL